MMSAEIITVLVLVLFAVLLLIEVPVAFALAISGIVGVIALRSVGVASSVLANVPFESTAKYSFVVIPMYILLGAFAMQARLPERLYSLAHRYLGRLPGGLGIATVAACAGFATVSGSSVATAATISKVSVREMIRHGYRPQFATGIVASAATLGILIPPSIILVIYAIMTGESIAGLFSAGIIPGALSAIVYVITILFLARKNVSSTAPAPAKVVPVSIGADGGGSVLSEAVPQPGGAPPVDAAAARVEFRASIRSVFYILVIFLVIMAGIFTGVMTASESAAVGALVALAVLLFERRKEGVRTMLRSLREGLSESSSITSMAFAILIGSSIFTFFLVSAGIPTNLSRFLTSLDVEPLLIVVLILLVVIPLGLFLDSLAILVLVVPIAYPAVTALGFDGIWFAILLVKVIEIGLVTPPVGMNCFVIAAASGVKVETVFRGVLPFLIGDLVLIGLFVAFPGIVTWLPSLL